MLFLYLFSLITLFLGANGLPHPIVPVEGTKFDVTKRSFAASFEQGLAEFQSKYGDDFSDDQFNVLYELNDEIKSLISKRDLESTIESVLNLVNSSGIIWNVLDSASESPSTISLIANLTSNLLVSALGDGESQAKSSNSSFDISLLSGVVKGVNVSHLVDTVLDSGLITSVLDGILLDENFRPTLVDLIYNVTESNKEVIFFLINKFLGSPDNRVKRDNSGSLIQFVGNIAGSFLSSDLFSSGLGDVLNALNDTGFVVYTIQRFLSTPAYINMTGELVTDIYDQVKGKVNLDISAINITSIVESVLKDPTAITGLLGGALTNLGASDGNSFVRTLVSRYLPGIKSIIGDLENKGLFVELNNYIFGSSSSAAPTATGKKAAGKQKEAAVTSGSSSAPASSKSASSSKDSAPQASTLKYLMLVQPILGYILFL